MKPDGPAGIGGWLIVPVFALFVIPVRMTTLMAIDYLPLFERAIWANLTTPSSALYHPLWAPAIFFELCSAFALVAFDLWLLVLLFKRSPLFPKAFVAFALVNLLLTLSDSVLLLQIPTVAAKGFPGAREIGGALAFAALWVPYMLVSKRVRNTFRAAPAKSE
jgi:hypothetical protein